jgi:hypothetical protein
MADASSLTTAPLVTITVTGSATKVEIPSKGPSAVAGNLATEPEAAPESVSAEPAVLRTNIESFQHVTAEENRHSFVKQFGRFTVHDETIFPDEDVSGTTGHAFALTTAEGFVVGGNASHVATLAVDLKLYLSRNGPARIYTTEKDFASLVPVGTDNRLIVWGPTLSPASICYPLGGIQAVYANRYAFAFIYKTPLSSGQRIGAIGDAAKGGIVPDDVQLKLAFDEPVSIRATEAAFAVLTRSGKVYAWGAASAGGTIDPATEAVLGSISVTMIFASSHAFCAVGADNEVVAWGHTTYGGTIPPAVLDAILDDDGAETIVAAQAAFCCITRGRRKALAWGGPAHGGSMPEAAAAFASRGDIVACKAAAWAFCMINKQGQAEAWGQAAHGGTLPPASATGIQSLPEGVLEGSDTRLEIQNALSRTSTRSSPREPRIDARYATADWTASIHAVDSGFCLVTTHPDGRIRSVTSWGAADTLVTDTVRQALLGSYLQGMTTSNRAYLAVVRQGRTDGCVIAWGEASTNGGAIPEEVRNHIQTGVVEAHAVNNMPALVTTGASTNVSGFFVRSDDGRVALWGGGTGTCCLLPKVFPAAAGP